MAQAANEWLAELPNEAQRTAEYEAELINRFNTGQFLTATDKREAKRLIARKSAIAAA